MPRVTGWSDDEFDDRAQNLAALIRRVWRAIARLIAAQAEQQSQVTLAVAKPIVPQWQQAVDNQIIAYVRNMYLDAAGTVSDALDAPDELLIGDDMVEVYTNAARNRLVGIGDDVWKNVQAQIALGNQSGESIAEIAARIRNVAGVSEGRSLTIARTEVHAAHEAGSYEQAVFVDPDAEKTWLATEDTRTRPSHRAVDGQTVKIGESFDVGGSKLRYPGDPLGAPEDCINCRCSVAYNFDMITAVVDEPEPAMVAAGGQSWKAHNHPRGTDGKFIEKGLVSDFLKKDKPNIIDVTKAVGSLDSTQWGKLTDAQKTHIKSSVDKLPKGTATHNQAQKTINSLETAAAAVAPAPKPKTKMGQIYDSLVDAKDGDVLATGTKYNAAGVPQKFKITADKSHVHPDYMPNGKLKLQFFKKNGEPGQATVGGPFTINQKLHPLPAKGKKASKVEWDDAPQASAPDADVVIAPTTTPNVDAPAAPATPAAPAALPAGLKGKPGDPAKITTGVVWGKHSPGTVVVEDEWGLLRAVWNGKKFEIQSKQDDGSWNADYSLTKKDFYDQHKGDGSGWVVPGGTPPSNDDDDENLPDLVDLEDDKMAEDEYLGDIGEDGPGDYAAAQSTSEPPQTPSTPESTVTPAATPGITEQQLGDLVTGMMNADTPGDWTVLQQKFHNDLAENSDKPTWTVPQNFVYFTKVGGQAGSNLGGTYKSPDGTKWYIKKPKSKNHAANEQAAAAFYNLAGIDAPQVMKGKGAPELSGLQTGTKIVPGAQANLGSKLNDKDYIKQIQSGFAMDAWLANWDVAGMGYDNVVEGADGKPHRIDVGGAMLYRAQGTPKGDEFGNTVGELKTLRDGTNPQAAAVFKSMTDEDIRKSAAKVEAISESQIDQIVKDAGLDASVAETLKARRKDILAKYPPITDTDELNEVLGPPTTVPNEASAKAKLKAQYDKGLITWDEYVDIAGEPPAEDDADEMYGGIADKDVLLNDLESGAILPVPQAIDLGIMLNESDYNDLSNMEKDQLEATLSTAARMDMPGGKDAYAHWQSLHNQPDDVAAPTTDEPDTGKVATSASGALYYLDTGDQTKMVSSDGKFVIEKLDGSPMGKYSLEAKNGQDDGLSVFAFINNADDVDYVTGQIASLWYPAKVTGGNDGPAAPAGPMIDGHTISLKAVYNLIQVGKFTDGQVVAVSSDGTEQYVWRNDLQGYARRNVASGDEEFISKLQVMKTIRTDGWHIPESNLPNHDGKLVELGAGLAVPEPNDPLIETGTIGTTNSGALFALENGDAESLTTIDGKYEMYKSADGKYTALKENHSDGNATINIIEPGELDNLVGLQVWYPKQEIDESTNAPDAPAGVSAKPVDLSVVQEDIELDKYTSGEIIGVTKDGQQKLTYSAFIGGVQLKHKVGNTGDDDMDWDTEASYSDDTGNPVADFLDDYPGIELFEPQDPNAVTADDNTNTSNVNWDAMLSGPYVYNDVVAQTSDGKYQLVHKGMGSYHLYAKADGGSVYSQIDGSYYHDDLTGGDLDNEILSTGHRWQKVNPGTQFKSGKTPPAKKIAPAKKVAKAAGMPKPGAYSPATVTANEKKFYLEDAEWGSLVAVEAVHLLNGAGGLDVHEAGKLTPTQTGVINTQLQKALDGNLPGSAAAWQKWAEFENQLNSGNGYDASKIADASYFFDMENDMWAGEKSTGDVFAITPDGKYRLVIHSTEGPFENPNSFALEEHGPLGWELNKIYTNTGDGSVPDKLVADTDTMSKTWLKPDAVDVTPAPAATPAVSFDPPGEGTQLPVTIFQMLSWAPDDKALLVGKDPEGGKWLMTAGKNADGEKVVKIASWHPSDGQFKPNAELANNQEYELWDDAGIKWDTPGTLPDQSALASLSWKSTAPAAPTPTPAPAPTPTYSPVLEAGSKLAKDHGPALWDVAQYLDEDTVVATGTTKIGLPIQMVVKKKHALGHSVLTVQKKPTTSGNWVAWYSLADAEDLTDDLGEESWHTEIDVPGVPDTSASPSGVSTPKPTDLDFSVENATKIWAAIQNMPDGTELATAESSAGFKKKMVVQTSSNNNAKYIDVQAWDSNTGAWEDYSSIGSVPMLSTSLMQTWDPIGVPNTSTPTPTPTAPTVSTPAAPKPVPLYKINILKKNMKADGNIGYWSKPENIWAQIKKFQALPGNADISPMDFFAALDQTLKTDKHSYVAKMTKWAASKKGAQIVGADGIYGPTPPTPTPSTSSSSSASMPDFTAANAAEIWDKIQTLPIDTVIAHSTNGGIKKQLVVKGSDPKYLEIQSIGYSDNYFGAYTSKAGLALGLDSYLKWAAPATTVTPPKAKATLPDIEAGNDISGINDAKQNSIYSSFKSHPYTYLSSPEHAIFDAVQDVAKNESLTFAQVISIIDAQGAKKFGVENSEPFKKKLTAWLKTPEAAAHVLNEPTVVKGLVAPPAFHPKYDPYLNPGQIPSFEESSKLTYDYVPSSAEATKIWSSIVAKTSDFSPAEKKALTVWTGGAYTTINGHLIKPNPGPLSSTHKSAMTGSQLGMRPSDRPMVLVRGTGFSGLGNAKNHAQLEKMVGTTWRNNGFAASSVGRESHDPPDVHAPAFNSYPLWIEFECPPGTPMAWVTPFSSVGTSEREMLLGANLHYKILSVEKKMIPGYGMKTIARVRIVPKPEGAAE